MTINKISSVSHGKNYFGQAPAYKAQHKQENKKEIVVFANEQKTSGVQQPPRPASNSAQTYQSTMERFAPRHIIENNFDQAYGTEKIQTPTEPTIEINQNQHALAVINMSHHYFSTGAAELTKFFATAKSTRSSNDSKSEKFIKAYEINQ